MDPIFFSSSFLFFQYSSSSLFSWSTVSTTTVSSHSVSFSVLAASPFEIVRHFSSATVEKKKRLYGACATVCFSHAVTPLCVLCFVCVDRFPAEPTDSCVNIDTIVFLFCWLQT